ncbi:MAG: hypothetical protein BIFFINMI_02163 [Phycisphaerae bacterium]|nr:hypothetical protein [Phycisphaerae bacterium]
MMMLTRLLAILSASISFVAAALAGPDTPAVDTANLPVNQWVRLPPEAEDGPGYSFSAMIYEPVRGQLLHWGGVQDLGRRPFAGRNDVRAFDAASGKWTSDYASTDATFARTGGGGGGQAPGYLGEALMRPDGAPRPDLHVFGVCYDSKRKQIVYAMPGLMASYDPAARKWTDMKARTILYGRELPGSPPVYGVGICYDPVNDEIVMFPHFTAKNIDQRDTTGEITGHYGVFRYSYADNTWRREAVKPGSGPEPRCAAPLIHDPKNGCIVMFGGHSGVVRNDLPDRAARERYSLGLDDTWRYDCKTRTWKELPCPTRPPRDRLPAMAYDPVSGLFVLLTFSTSGKQARATLWSLDVATGEWLKRNEQDWPGPYFGHGHTGGWTPDQMMALDQKARTLVVVQPEGPKGEQTTYLLRLDLSQLPAAPAPAADPAPPVKPQTVPDDDPAWIARLKALPANTWVNTHPDPETPTRDWGSISVDPARGWVFYFGGGHSTYQNNDVAIYNVGANRWSNYVGTNNDFIPYCGWEGSTLGFRGGPPARHMRNQYQAFDGRMYRSIGNVSSWPSEFFEPGYAFFYDFTRGGVWREQKIEVDKKPADLPDDFDGLQMTDPRGRILSIQLAPVQRYDYRVARCVFRSYDVAANRLTVRQVDGPCPQLNDGECRPFCYLPDRDQILWVEHHAKAGNHNTWIFDVKACKWTNAKPKHNAPGLPVVVEYVEPAGCALGVFRVGNQDEQWVYSVARNDWTPLEFKVAEGSRVAFQHPYGQMVWVQKFDVLVNHDPRAGTSVMRPDLSVLPWP